MNSLPNNFNATCEGLGMICSASDRSTVCFANQCEDI